MAKKDYEKQLSKKFDALQQEQKISRAKHSAENVNKRLKDRAYSGMVGRVSE